jgi:hypothetical protein
MTLLTTKSTVDLFYPLTEAIALRYKDGRVTGDAVPALSADFIDIRQSIIDTKRWVGIINGLVDETPDETREFPQSIRTRIAPNGNITFRIRVKDAITSGDCPFPYTTVNLDARDGFDISFNSLRMWQLGLAEFVRVVDQEKQLRGVT